MSKQKHAAPHSAKARVGGSATARGLAFQEEVALLRVLELLGAYCASPLDDPEVGAEWRELAGAHPTAWDLITSPPKVLTECKLQPSRADVQDWLRWASQLPANIESKLVFSGHPPPLLCAVQRLCAIATEASGSLDRFNQRIALENGGLNEVLSLVGSGLDGVTRLEAVCLPREVVAQTTLLYLKWMFGAADAQNARRILVEKVSQATQQRQTFPISQVFADLKAANLEPALPPNIQPANLSAPARSALYLLQRCLYPLPAAVVESVAGVSADNLAAQLTVNQQSIVEIKDGSVAVARLPLNVTAASPAQIFSTALPPLLAFARNAQGSEAAIGQIENALTIAKGAGTTSDTAQLFDAFEGALKNRGDKRLVLEAATIAIAAARRQGRCQPDAEQEAKALICGISWVHQRLGDLDAALAEANASLKLGEDIGYARNTAFCHKCIGRLHRLRKDHAASEASLQTAIADFQRLGGTWAEEEIGDCYSLLGRTAYDKGDLATARAWALQANDKISSNNIKHHCDLKILLGDLAASQRLYAAAEAEYSDVVDVVAGERSEISEIRARAFLARGTVRLKTSAKPDAEPDLQEAARIWYDLDEPRQAAEAEWLAIREFEVPDGSAPRALTEERDNLVRVLAWQAHCANLNSAGRQRTARRTQPDEQYWKRLLDQARNDAAVKFPTW